MSTNEHPVSTKHEFADDEICIHCGADLEDALDDAIGCEAGSEGNPPGYLGFARTPAEQAAGMTQLQKAQQMFAEWGESLREPQE